MILDPATVIDDDDEGGSSDPSPYWEGGTRTAAAAVSEKAATPLGGGGVCGILLGRGFTKVPWPVFPRNRVKGAYGVLFGEGSIAAEAIFLYFRLKKTEAVCGKGLS